MQFTLIGVQNNGQQIVLMQDAQEHSVSNMVRACVSTNESGQMHKDVRYRSFLALGTTVNSTLVVRYNARGDVVARQAGLA